MKPLYLPTDQLVVHQINLDNPGANLSLDKVNLSAPTVVDKTGADSKHRNTSITVMSRKGKGFRGEESVDFNRLDMTALFRFTNVFLDVHTPATTTDLLATLQRDYGIMLTAADIVPAPIAPDTNPPLENPEDPDPIPVDHTITIAATCPSYIGSLAVKIGPKPATGERLSLVITKTELDGLSYPDGSDATKGQGYLYSYGVDCTPLLPYFETMVGTTVGTVIDSAELAKQINKVFYEEWVSADVPGAFNLKGAKLKYIGPTSTTSPTGTEYIQGVNQAFSDVMIVELDATNCTNFQGELWLHHNA